MSTRMAGDRGLAFVVVGLIGVSAFFVSNHGHMAPTRSIVHAAGIVSNLVPVSAIVGTSSGAAPSAGSLDDTDAKDDTPYIFRVRDTAVDDAVTGSYFELTGSAAKPLPRIRQRLRLPEDFGLTPPLN